MGYRIVAVSDSQGAISMSTGFDVHALEKHKETTGSVVGFEGSQVIEDVLTQEVDILVPAALENVITADNASDIRANAIVELANGPTTPEADEVLKEKGIVVVPDVLANAGGVTVSYFEWDQNVKGEHWTEADVLEKLEKIMVTAFDEVWTTKEKFSIDMRTAAFVKAVERVVKKMKI
jgi:glutamate dehydrogenase/leucine dehydrogenase